MLTRGDRHVETYMNRYCVDPHLFPKWLTSFVREHAFVSPGVLVASSATRGVEIRHAIIEMRRRPTIADGCIGVHGDLALQTINIRR